MSTQLSHLLSKSALSKNSTDQQRIFDLSLFTFIGRDSLLSVLSKRSVHNGLLYPIINDSKKISYWVLAHK